MFRRLLLALLLLGLMTLTGISSCDPIIDPGGFCISNTQVCGTDFLGVCCQGLVCGARDDEGVSRCQPK